MSGTELQVGRGLGYPLWLRDGRVRGLQVRARRVKSPSRMVAITDAAADGYNDFLCMPQASDPRLWPGEVHGGGANVLFCDGHVRWHPQKGLLVSPMGPTPRDNPIRRMWNSDHQP